MSSAGWQARGREGMGCDSIDNLSPSLWPLAWLGSALAEVCQYVDFSNSNMVIGQFT